MKRLVNISFALLAIVVYTLYVLNNLICIFSITKREAYMDFAKDTKQIQQAIANVLTFTFIALIYLLIKYLIK